MEEIIPALSGEGQKTVRFGALADQFPCFQRKVWSRHDFFSSLLSIEVKHAYARQQFLLCIRRGAYQAPFRRRISTLSAQVLR
ncbi:hypothetical protein FNJ84_20950 [Paracoccus sp. M683]|uniref:hypothetical protein n=1 Tax=Paracoccus sp. M683 TaxID=2594268 RepID=UPI00117D3B84|nr:hypothetical protein [Paracoccus sp. M683]TRW92740.1 hypothetical protein FNJ84_20950 [Paracoccus sp. M683]